MQLGSTPGKLARLAEPASTIAWSTSSTPPFLSLSLPLPTLFSPRAPSNMGPKNDDPSIPSVSPLFNPLIASHVPPDPPHAERTPEPDRALFADPEKKALLSAATKVDDLTGSIGTELHGINLRDLSPKQKDELALLVAEVRLRHSATLSRSR